MTLDIPSSVRREVCCSMRPSHSRAEAASWSDGVVVRSLGISMSQCADDPDAVCTRSVSVRLSALHNSLMKLKHGGGVAIDGQDVQIPFLQGKLMPTSSASYQPMSLPAEGIKFFPGNLMKI